MLNQTNFKGMKEVVEIILGYIDLDLALRTKWPIFTIETSVRSNLPYDHEVLYSIGVSGLCFWRLKCKEFTYGNWRVLCQKWKAETSTILAKLISMKYKGKGNIIEYIMKMSNLASKLKSLKLEHGDDLLMHLILISLPAYSRQFKVSIILRRTNGPLTSLYLTMCKREKGYREIELKVLTWLQHIRIRKGERLRMLWKDLFRKRNKKRLRNLLLLLQEIGTHEERVSKYATWRVKKGKFLTLVCSAINLTFVLNDTWWVDFGATITHISMSL